MRIYIRDYVSTIIFYLLLISFVSVVNATPEEIKEQVISSDSGNDVAAEYDRLLKMVKKKRKPVQSIDGILDITNRPGVGKKDSEVILVEFGDFQCPFCRKHLLGTAQKIYREMVLTGKLRYVFLDFPLEEKHPLAAKAAVAARCAEEQEKYWEMRNVLYNNYKALQEIFLSEHAKKSGLDMTSFNQCLESNQYSNAIQQDIIIGKSLGVKATPTFFVGIKNGGKIDLIRIIRGAQHYELFEKEILNALKLINIKNTESAFLSNIEMNRN